MASPLFPQIRRLIAKKKTSIARPFVFSYLTQWIPDNLSTPAKVP